MVAIVAMKNVCPKCGRYPDGVIMTRQDKFRTLYTLFHIAENEDGFLECRFAAKRKMPKKLPGVNKP